jgi:chemotaxis signal transduction protein
MVNIVKARAKAKKSGAPASAGEPKPPAEAGAPQAPHKLDRFKETAGVRQVQTVAAPTVQPDLLHLLTFAIDGEQYAIEIERVVEISPPRPLTRVPNADPFVLGVMSLRGAVVSMVDVRTRLRHKRSGAGEQVIVVTDGAGLIGFDVDRVLRPLQLGRESFEPHPVVHVSEERPAIRGVFRRNGALTILLDLEKLLS